MSLDLGLETSNGFGKLYSQCVPTITLLLAGGGRERGQMEVWWTIPKKSHHVPAASSPSDNTFETSKHCYLLLSTYMWCMSACAVYEYGCAHACKDTRVRRQEVGVWCLFYHSLIYVLSQGLPWNRELTVSARLASQPSSGIYLLIPHGAGVTEHPSALSFYVDVGIWTQVHEGTLPTPSLQPLHFSI